LHGFVSRCDPIEARLRKAPTSTFPARERSLSPTSRYALFPGETDKVKHWGVSNGYCWIEVADGLCKGEEMIIWEVSATASENIGHFSAVLAFTQEDQYAGGPTEFQRTTAPPVEVGAYFGNFGPGKF